MRTGKNQRPRTRPFHVIGVTGGIGSGKSTVSGMLVKHGARLIDADAISRRATEPGMPAVQEIVERFGEALVDREGRLDRAALAGLVFADPAGRKDLERIIHKKVVEAIDACLGAWTAEAYDGLVVLDVPIPVERGFQDVCDEIWVVDGSEDVRAGRVALRSGLSEEAVRARMAAQNSREAYCALATRLIRNDGRLDQLEQLVQEGLEQEGLLPEQLVREGLEQEGLLQEQLEQEQLAQEGLEQEGLKP